MTCRAPVYQICLTRGATYKQRMRVASRSSGTTTPIDITGDTFALYAVDGSGAALASLTSAGGEIAIIDGSGGVIELSLSDEATAVLRATRGTYTLWWERSTGERVRLLSGHCVIQSAVEAPP